MYTVMIVDDEKHIRRSIINRIDWASLGLRVVAEADNGRSACEVFAHCNPDITLVDIKMPVMNGLEFIKTVTSQFGEKHFIVLSGYDDYIYMKEALKLKAANYIKKPIDELELSETLWVVARQLDERKRNNEKLSVLTRKAGLAESMQQDAYLHELFEKLPLLPGGGSISFPHAQFAVALLYDRDLAVACEAAEVLKARANTMFEGVIFKIFANRHCQHEIRILINADALGDPRLKDIAECLLKEVPESSLLSVSSIRSSLDGIGRLYDEALERLKQSVLESGRLFMKDEENEWPDKAAADALLKFTADRANALKNALEENDRRKVVQAFDNLFDSRNEALRSVALLKVVVREISNTLERTALKMNLPIHDIRRFGIDQPHYLLRFRNVAQLQTDLIGMIDEIFGFFKNEETSLVEKIRSYITTHYEEDLSLSVLAGKFYLNPNYLSQVFKAKTGENISIYIEKVRIERAEELLAHLHMAVTQVAQYVGYNDSNYFSKVFRKRTGMLPSEYQKQHET